MQRDVPQADIRKPSPDEPYRYVCPECRGQVHGQYHTLLNFRCSSCDETWERDELYDQKRNVVIGQRSMAGGD